MKIEIFGFSLHTLPSKENETADFESRRLEPETEFELNKSAFAEICKTLGTPDIDLFAS